MFESSFKALVSARYSCRAFDGEAVEREKLGRLQAFAEQVAHEFRFVILAATPDDAATLRGLGTYGFIRGASAFIVGIAKRSPSETAALVDFGRTMELVVLKATELGLGTCWLGGTFSRSGFAKRAGVDKRAGEFIPAVIAVGNIDTNVDTRNSGLRARVGGASRKPWTALVFDAATQAPLVPEEAGEWAPAVEALRWAPSASNKQPWRLHRDGETWHLRLERTPGYRGSALSRLMGVADLQMSDMGIAMAHFEGVARELGLPGTWSVLKPTPAGPGEYIGTWG